MGQHRERRHVGHRAVRDHLDELADVGVDALRGRREVLEEGARAPDAIGKVRQR